MEEISWRTMEARVREGGRERENNNVGINATL